MKFKFCTHIYRLNRSKSPLKFLAKQQLAQSGTPENFQGTHTHGASRGHLCDSSAFLFSIGLTYLQYAYVIPEGNVRLQLAFVFRYQLPSDYHSLFADCDGSKDLSTPGNKVAENGNNCCRKRQICYRKRQQIVARNGDFDRCCDNVAVSGNNLLPFSATNCCRFRQQFVAWCGQALSKHENRRKMKKKHKIKVGLLCLNLAHDIILWSQ